MKNFIHFADGSTWPNPDICLKDEIPDHIKDSIVDAYYYLTTELSIKEASKRISKIRKYLKHENNTSKA